MGLESFSLDNLTELDGGKASLVFEKHLRRAALDCYDRPGDPAGRKVVLEFVLKPVLDEDGSCTEVSAAIAAKSSVPVHKTRAYSLGLKPNGSLVFNPDSPDRVGQSTLFDEEV
jgi:hypothetical protein